MFLVTFLVTQVKFAQNASIGEVMMPLEQNFETFPVRGRFFKKAKKSTIFSTRFPTSDRHNSETIRYRRKNHL